jgi:hypothetical protein
MGRLHNRAVLFLLTSRTKKKENKTKQNKEQNDNDK